MEFLKEVERTKAYTEDIKKAFIAAGYNLPAAAGLKDFVNATITIAKKDAISTNRAYTSLYDQVVPTDIRKYAKIDSITSSFIPTNNLLPFPYAEMGYSDPIDQFDIIVNDDGSVMRVGVSTAGHVSILYEGKIPLENQKYYTVTDCSARVYEANGVSYTDKVGTFKASSGQYISKVMMNSVAGHQYNNLVRYPRINEGNQPLPFEKGYGVKRVFPTAIISKDTAGNEIDRIDLTSITDKLEPLARVGKINFETRIFDANKQTLEELKIYPIDTRPIDDYFVFSFPCYYVAYCTHYPCMSYEEFINSKENGLTTHYYNDEDGSYQEILIRDVDCADLDALNAKFTEAKNSGYPVQIVVSETYAKELTVNISDLIEKTFIEVVPNGTLTVETNTKEPISSIVEYYLSK